MKKTAIAMALAGFTTLVQAAPKDDTWYVGGKVGWSRYDKTGMKNDFKGIGDGPTRKDQLGAGAFLGYQVNQYLGFELGGDWFGRMAYKGNTKNGAFKAYGAQLGARFSYPVAQDLDIYTRVGGEVWKAKTKGNINGKRLEKSDTGVSPFVAVGFEYALTESLATRLDYQWTRKIGDSKDMGVAPHNGMLSLGLSYRFNQDEPAVMVPPPVEPPLAEVVETKNFVLESDVVFGFNQSKLSKAGEQKLDQLYAELSHIDPKEGSVTILGFTDRIGKKEYNEKLSYRRAQAAADYIISKGIPADKVTVQSLGATDSVTGSKCDNVKKRTELIKCLAPDRRVDVKVSGNKVIITQPAENNSNESR